MTTAIANRLEKVFHPVSVAVVGAKRANNYNWLRTMSQFRGPLYHVNIDRNEWQGAEELGLENFQGNYERLTDIPGPVGYVLVSVPNQVVPLVLADAIKKGVGSVTLFTSGFGEIHTEEGRQLAETITRMAREADLPLIGPNCMGIFNPSVGLRTTGDQYVGETGPVGLISQSGTHTGQFSSLAYQQGVKLSKAVSMGNGYVLEAADYLEYFAQDDSIEYIALYLEGVGDGRRFFKLLRGVTPRKPVVIWKGGRTDDGSRAIRSHSGSLAIPSQVWGALIKQCGVVEVQSMDELVDTMMCFLHTKPNTGRRMGLLASTGGQSVVMADAFCRNGLEVPPLSEESYERLSSFFNIIGGSYRNPFDGMGGDRQNLSAILDILDSDPKVDAIGYELSAGFMRRLLAQNPNLLESILDTLAAFKERSAKPLIAMVHPGTAHQEAAELRAKMLQKGIPAFASFDRAARALHNVARYYQYRAQTA